MMGLAVMIVCSVVSCCVAWHLRCLTATLGPGANVRPACKEDAWEACISCTSICACRKLAEIAECLSQSTILTASLFSYL